MTSANEIALTANGTAGIALQFTKSSRLEDHIASEAGRLIEDLKWALNCDLSAARTSAAHLATFLASKLSVDAHTPLARGGLAPWQKRKVLNHIENGLEDVLPVEDLAKIVSLSPSHFCRVFKESFGESPHGFITKLRVERAKTLMLTTTESLSQIALACGLADQAHLCRCFRRVTGTTPGFWRRSRATGPRSTTAETSIGQCIEYS